MSNSPFAAFTNATLTFAVTSGSLVTDSNGNQRPGTATITVKAWLEQEQRPQTEPRPGVDTTAVYLEGYAVDPLKLPSVITPDSPCAATWSGRSGKFFLELTGRSGVGFEDVTGDEIKGYFQL